METDKGCGGGQYPSGPWIPDLLENLQPTGELATFVQHGSLETCDDNNNNNTRTAPGTPAAFIWETKGPNASGLFDVL